MSEPSRAGLPATLLPPEPWPQRLSRILAWLAGALILFGCSGLISIDVITRLIFGRGIVESFELSGYAMAAAIGTVAIPNMDKGGYNRPLFLGSIAAGGTLGI